MKLALLFLASLAFAQDAEKPEQCADQKQEIQRLTTLLNWYQQQFFMLQARQIEQQIAPVKPQQAAPQKPKQETK